MQRVRLVNLKSQLVEQALALKTRSLDPRNDASWSARLKTYIDAIRDYDFILSCHNREEGDPFMITSTRYFERIIIQAALNQIDPMHLPIAYRDLSLSEASVDDMRNRPTTSKRLNSRRILERLCMAVFGGVFLIGPMWLMVLRSEQIVQLCATSAFVVVFALCLSVGLPNRGPEVSVTVMTATAAYAAVLVVFVGAKNST